jgi:Tfp pilus assembly protein PilF
LDATVNLVDNLEKMLAAGRETALLRFSLGNAYFKRGDNGVAAEHLARAVELDPEYSAAWKIYGRALAAAGLPKEAQTAFEHGIRAAEARGDKQAAREMQVFLNRAQKQQ